ncbi:MAG: hypothetical protein GW938_05990 [Leptospira sp.]|nr:hypothetical protein [Leptospira sp.]NCS92601.1 hypothetical protein [Leptospira sp.]
MKTPIVFLLLLLLTSCDYLDDMARENWQKKQAKNQVNFEDVEKWKQTLAINESELRNLDKSIHDMVGRTAQAGALSWKIAQAYMKASNYEMGIRFYQRALDESISSKQDSSLSQDARNQGRVAYWESALPYFDKSLIYRDVDMTLLFEMGLAYANASKDMGWEPERRSRAVEIFQALVRYDPKDTRFPYQLALIYFDSSVSTGTWAIKEGYRDIEKALSLIDAILLAEPENVATRFAKANFFYQLGKTNQAYSEYQNIKATIEDLDRRGEIRGGLENNSSYQNVIRNIDKIQSSNLRK